MVFIISNLKFKKKGKNLTRLTHKTLSDLNDNRHIN